MRITAVKASANEKNDKCIFYLWRELGMALSSICIRFYYKGGRLLFSRCGELAAYWSATYANNHQGRESGRASKHLEDVTRMYPDDHRSVSTTSGFNNPERCRNKPLLASPTRLTYPHGFDYMATTAFSGARFVDCSKESHLHASVFRELAQVGLPSLGCSRTWRKRF